MLAKINNINMINNSQSDSNNNGSNSNIISSKHQAAVVNDGGGITTPCFIALEGIDGAGKSTQVNMLAQALKKQGNKIVKTREPGGTEIADEIRKLVLNPTVALNKISELLLILAARSEHIDKLIKPSLEAGNIVITDRFMLSTYAYQAYGGGLSLEYIKTNERAIMGELKPDITFLIDLEAELALQRVKARQQTLIKDKFEMMELEFFKKVRAGFLAIVAEKASERIIILDGTKTEGELHAEIMAQINKISHQNNNSQC